MAAMPMMASIPEDSSYRFTYNPVLIEVDKDSAESFFFIFKSDKKLCFQIFPHRDWVGDEEPVAYR